MISLIKDITDLGLPILAEVLKSAGQDKAGAMIDRISKTLGVPPDKIGETIKTDPLIAAEKLAPIEEFLSAQISLNAKQAESASFFIAGARPAMMWVSVLSLMAMGVIIPVASFVMQATTGSAPVFPVPEFIAWGMVSLALGLAGVRGLEKWQGVSRSGWGVR